MKVSFDKLEDAFFSSSEESSNWVDRKNGNVILIGSESVFGEVFYDVADEAQAAHEIRILCGEIENVENIEIDKNRYVSIAPPHSGEKWKWMEEFTVFHIENVELQNKLADTLRGRKPFRKFKDVLIYEPDTEKKWFEFENKKLCEFIEDWAESEQIEIDFET